MAQHRVLLSAYRGRHCRSHRTLDTRLIVGSDCVTDYAMPLLLLRHAETEWNTLGKLQGRLVNVSVAKPE